jgi:hypothetical protein
LAGHFAWRLGACAFVEEPAEEGMVPARKVGEGGGLDLGGGIDLDDAGADALDDVGVAIVLMFARERAVVDAELDGFELRGMALEGLVHGPGAAGAEGGDGEDQSDSVSERVMLGMIHGWLVLSWSVSAFTVLIFDQALEGN